MPSTNVFLGQKEMIKNGKIYSRYHITFNSDARAKSYLKEHNYDGVFTIKRKDGKFVAYVHLSTSDRLWGGKRYSTTMGTPDKKQAYDYAKRLGNAKVKSTNKNKNYWVVWREVKRK